MNIYEVGADLAYGTLVHTDESSDAEQQGCWDAVGKPSAVGWQPPSLESPRGKAKALPLDCVDAIAIGPRCPLLSTRARAVLAPLLLPNGEYLQVRWDQHDYCWFNCLTTVDIADHDGIEGERSKYLTEPPNCWKSITRWSFHSKQVATAPPVFNVPQQKRTLMCTDVLRDAVQAHDLLGFDFKLLWSLEEGGTEINNSPAQFFGESGRRMNIAGKERRKAMLATLKARAKANRT